MISRHYPDRDILHKTERYLLAKWGIENNLANSHAQANADLVGLWRIWRCSLLKATTS